MFRSLSAIARPVGLLSKVAPLVIAIARKVASLDSVVLGFAAAARFYLAIKSHLTFLDLTFSSQFFSNFVQRRMEGTILRDFSGGLKFYFSFLTLFMLMPKLFITTWGVNPL